MTKTHYRFAGANGANACGRRGSRGSTNVYAVDCEPCKTKQIFIEDLVAANREKRARFEAQTPRPATHLFGGAIICACGGNLFRQADRTCYGHYANYVCADCGTTTQTITETGASF